MPGELQLPGKRPTGKILGELTVAPTQVVDNNPKKVPDNLPKQIETLLELASQAEADAKHRQADFEQTEQAWKKAKENVTVARNALELATQTETLLQASMSKRKQAAEIAKQQATKARALATQATEAWLSRHQSHINKTAELRKVVEECRQQLKIAKSELAKKHMLLDSLERSHQQIQQTLQSAKNKQPWINAAKATQSAITILQLEITNDGNDVNQLQSNLEHAEQRLNTEIQTWKES